MRILSFSGSPATIGAAFGEQCRAEIAELYAARLQNAVAQAKQHGGRDVSEDAVLAVARACVEPTRAHHPDGFAELEGIARGANMTVERVLAMNGLTDLRDVLAWGGELEALGGCSSFLVATPSAITFTSFHSPSSLSHTSFLFFIPNIIHDLSKPVIIYITTNSIY